MQRRTFLHALLAAATAALIAAWGLLSAARRKSAASRRISVAAPTVDGVTFDEDVLLVRRGGQLKAYWSRCPHLGCRIQRVEGEQLVCPCHGSRFDLDGRVLTGPASTDLRALEFEREDRDDGRIDVVVPS
ncbi:MAG TPA: Rieske (2Fe-2S) protein [Myxococcales bacterium]|jgi:nitrite reductase/ring-hydroxylating ferredoxin subunit